MLASRASTFIRIALLVSAVLVFAVASSWVLDQATCTDCTEWLTTENTGRVMLASNSSIALGFHYDGPDKDYQQMMDEIWVAQMFYHELAAPLLEERHLMVSFRIPAHDYANFRGLTMCVVDHLELKTTNAATPEVGTCMMRIDEVKEVDIRIPIGPSAYEPHHARYSDLRYLEFFVVLQNPTLYNVDADYDFYDVLVVRTPYDYTRIMPNLAILSISILVLLAATATNLPAYPPYMLSKLSQYLPYDVGRTVGTIYAHLAKWALFLNLLAFIVPIMGIVGVLYRVGLWAPSIKVIEGEVYPQFLMGHDYVDYLLLIESDFAARVQAVKGFLDMSLALLPLHVIILALTIRAYLAYLRKTKLNPIIRVRSYGTMIISLSFVMLSPILLLLTVGSGLAQQILASSPAASALDATSFDKLRLLVFNDAWEMRLIYEPAAYLIALPLLLMGLLLWAATAAVLFRREHETALGSLLHVERERYRRHLIVAISTWALVEAVLIVFSPNFGANTIYSFLLALTAPYLRDFLGKRHLT